MQQVKHKGTGRLFKSPVLEMLTKTGPILSVAYYGSIIAFALWWSYTNGYATGTQALGLYLTGLVIWTLAEYTLHRYLFHWVSDSDFSKKFHYTIHGVHHEYPNDKDRLFMPPVPGAILVTVLTGLFYLIMGNYAFAFLAGFINGYLLYAFTHYSIHTIRKPPRLWRPVWYYHNLHHYKYQDKIYGVSNMFWDRVFGTMPPKEDWYKHKSK